MAAEDKPSNRSKQETIAQELDAEKWAAAICARLREIDSELLTADREGKLALLEERVRLRAELLGKI